MTGSAAAVRGAADGREALVQLAECQLPQVPTGYEWLSPAEREVLGTLQLEKRRSEWRLGRWCARQALRGLGAASLDAVSILAAPDGAPTVEGFTLSITHRAGRAAAVASTAPLRLGCDLERVEPRTERFVRDYFTAAEAELVLAADGEVRAVLANLCWSAKEAVLKAQRVGLRADTRSVEIGLHEVTLLPERWNPIRARSSDGTAFGGRWRLSDGWLLTVLADVEHRLHMAQSVF